MKQLVCVLGLLCCAGLTMAASLENRDSQSYKVKIIDSGSTTSTSISSHTLNSTFCSGCTIEVEGVGTIELEDSDAAVIHHGELSK